MTKKIEQTYKVLDEIEHVRVRAGMYAGSTSIQQSEEWIFNTETRKMERRSISYIPAFIKIFSEILDNAIDESKRAPDVLTTIKVDVDSETGEISVHDNGRGIPVEIHPQTGTYVAETVFSNLRAGSNFNDEEDQSLIGTNGVGSTITNILSSSFKIDSCDGKKRFKQEFSEGMRKKSEPKISSYDKKGTKISFVPDYSYFKLDGIDDFHFLKIMKKVIDASGCNPHLKFYFNGERLQIRDFEDYCKLYSDDVIVEQQGEWTVGVAHSDGFQQVSFVNSVETYQGGTHVDFVGLEIANKLREFFKKKHKVDVKPAEIRGHIMLFISCSINRPKFSSQTKENMISPAVEWKSSYNVTDKFINKIVKSTVIQSILDWVEAKAFANERAELRKLNKDTDKTNPRRIVKLTDASLAGKQPDKCILFLCEGDSAQKVGQSTRDPKTMGFFALKGKPLNVNSVDLKKIMENEEFKNILIIMGLKLGEEVKSVRDLRYGKLSFMTDQDLDGMHISGLLINMLYKFWPELFTMGVIHRFITPLIKVKLGKQELNFYDEHEFKAWKDKNPGVKFDHKYFKGLGTSKSEDFKKYFEKMDQHLIQLTMPDKLDGDAVELVFGKEVGQSDKRKSWLAIEEV